MNYFITSKTLPYALDDTLNYNYILQNTVVDCFTTYIGIINAYIAHFSQSKSIHTLYTSNKILYNYLLDKGVSTINHIFKIMLLYTKNLDLANHYCRQTIGYYVEFIEQNMQHEDNEKINYNNASRFSYSKTIDKLIKHYRKTSYNELDDNTSGLLYVVEAKETDIYNTVNMLIEVYNKFVAVGSVKIIQHLLNLATDEAYPREKLAVLLTFINNFHLKDVKYIYCLCEYLKYDLPSKVAIIKKLSSSENKIRLQTDSVDEYIGWVIV